MRRFLWQLMLSFLTKYNGGLAGLVALMIIIGASVNAMHGQFQQAQTQSGEATQQVERPCQSDPCSSTPHQTNSFNLLRLFFSRDA